MEKLVREPGLTDEEENSLKKILDNNVS